MKHTLIWCALALATSLSVGSIQGAEKAKADTKAAASKEEPKAKRDTYPLYGKVVAITSRTLTIVRSDSADATEAKYTINSSTEIVNGDKPATTDDVKVGRWVGGLLKKAEGDGNDVVLKLNIAAKQKEAKADEAKGKKKASAKSGTK